MFSLNRRARSYRRFRPLRAEALESRLAPAGDITTGLVHYWTFDETSGDTAHDIVGGSDGTLLNWDASEAKWSPGRVGGALDFSTADDAVIVTPPAMSGSYAVSFWLNVTDRSGTNPRVFTARTDNQITVNNESNSSIGFYSNGQTTFEPQQPMFNTWDHYALNFNAVTGQGIIYRNGAPVAVGSYSDAPSLANWVFGHSTDLSNTTDSFHGLLDDLRVYNRLLSDDDIAALANMGTPAPTHQGPVHEWTFDETSGYTAHDSVGGADGALLNWNPTEPRWTPGIVGGALAFTTADDEVVTPPISTQAQWTVAFWVNVMGQDGINPRIVEPWASINFDGNRGMGFSYQNTDTFDNNEVTIGRWEQYTITFDAVLETGTVFRNGIAVQTGFLGGNSPAFQLVFGHNQDPSNPNDSLHGLLDDLRIYDRVLSPSEIQQLVSATTPPPPPQGLTHHWTFDETSGDIAHDSVGGNDATLENWSPTENKWVPGHVGGAVSFSDANDLILTSAPILQNQYTIAFWLETTGPGGTDPRIAAPIGTLNDWVLINNEVNKGVGFYYRDSSGFALTPPTPGTWEHYAIVADQAAGTAKVYRNGVLAASGTFNDVPALQQWVFGHNSDITNHTNSFAGLLDDLRIYDRLLTPDEVKRLATGQSISANGDTYSTQEDIPLVVDAAQGVLVNDSDLDDNAPHAALAVDAVHGTVDMNADGSFVYQPAQDYNGPDSFSYKVTDSQGNTAVATVSLNITPVNDPPSFVVGGDRFVTDISGSRQIGHWAFDVSPGPADEAGQQLTFICTADKPELLAVQPQVVVAFGTYGSLTYTLKPNAVGVVTVTVVLKDDGGTADGGSDESPPQTFKINISKAHPAHNEILALDVDDDGFIAASDALAIINYINANGSGAVDPVKGMAAPYEDVNGDGQIAADDVLAVINHINANPPATAVFQGIDSTTQGNWESVYGADGYIINSGPTSLPSYVNLSFSGEYDVTWAASTDDPRAIQEPGTSDRIASAWTGHNSSSIPLNGFTMDLDFTDGKAHRVAIYALDWDAGDRTQQIDVIDAGSNQVIDTQPPVPFHDGKYYVWTISGHVQIRFTNLANGLNAVASGVFFG